VAITGANDLKVQCYAYFYGITFSAGSGSSAANIQLNGTPGGGLPIFMRFDHCNFQLLTTASSPSIDVAQNAANCTLLRNCGFKLGAAGQAVTSTGFSRIRGGSFLSGTTTPTKLGSLGQTFIEGFDFSNLSSSANLYGCSNTVFTHGAIRNSKMPANWSGSVRESAGSAGVRFLLTGVDTGTAVNQLWYEQYASSSVKHETTIVRTGGATDGTTQVSWKMVSGAEACSWTGVNVLESPEIAIWNATTGSQKTATVEFVHDTNTAPGQGAGTLYAFRNDEVWLEVSYYGDASSTIASLATSQVADPTLATPADIASSSTTWTTTGLTTPVKQKLSVSFTPQLAGYITARVCLGKASKTLYVDPVVTLS
jgi:hypothetical protein